MPTEEARQIGSRIVSRRKAIGWSQARLASEVGRSQPLICALELGKGGVSVKTFADIARALDITLDELVAQ